MSAPIGQSGGTPAQPGPDKMMKLLIYRIYALVFPYLALWFVGKRTIKHLSKNPSVMTTIRTILRSIYYVHFFTEHNRARMFVRAAVSTPSQILSSIPGERVIAEDPTVERSPQSPNWDGIRKRIYRRDDYTCQCCGAKGVRTGTMSNCMRTISFR